MYTVIARKYRPQTFSEVVNQEHIKQTLRNAIEQQRIAHGYIFAGQRGTGKTTMARLLAKALNCKRGASATPCLECESCREVAASGSTDVLEIDAASNRGIDDIRGLRENARYAPSRDRYKFFIIDEAHQLTREAWNALLKTLEEPPPHVIFVLCTTEAHSIPTTIASRCQTFIFHNLSFEETVKQLQRIAASEGITATEEALAVITQAADGSLRDALSTLDQAIACCGLQLDGETLRGLLGVVSSAALDEVTAAVQDRSPERALALVDALVREGQNLRNFAAQLTRHFRNLLVLKAAAGSPQLVEAPGAERQRLAGIAARFSEDDLTRFLQITLKLYQDLHHSPQPRFHTELGLLKLVHAARLVPIEEMIARLDTGGAPVPPPPPARSGPTPFERDLARRQGAPPPRPAATAGPAAPAGPEDDFASQLIARVESAGRMMLGIQLEKAVTWEVAQDSVVAGFPQDGGVHLPGADDQRWLANLATEILGRPVQFRASVLKADAAAATAGSRRPATPAASGAGAYPEEVDEFLRRFPGSAIEKQERR
jgi:DNA polymerase-3 subunit gamma/tau